MTIKTAIARALVLLLAVIPAALILVLSVVAFTKSFTGLIVLGIAVWAFTVVWAAENSVEEQ